CPHDWYEFLGTASCYRFVRYPKGTYQGAIDLCQSNLLSVETLPEHLFVQDWLNNNDPSTQKWLTSGRRNGIQWQWFTNQQNIPFMFDQGWLPRTEIDRLTRSYLVYAYQNGQWGWLPYDMAPTETLAFVCEVLIRDTYGVLSNYRGIEYGLPSNIERRFVPRAPKFYEQPEDQEFGRLDIVTFGSSFGMNKYNLEIVVTLTCRADAFPIPNYRWFKMGTDGQLLAQAIEVNLTNPRYFQHGGALMINFPVSDDSGTYFCKAWNNYGTAVSNKVNLREITLGQFEKRERPKVVADGHRDAIIDCLYKNTNTGNLNYAWFKGGINQKVQQTRERFISRNGNLYFSRVTDGDSGKYYCAVQSDNPRLRYLPSQTSEGTELEVRSTFGQERSPRIFPNFPHVFPTTRLPKLGENASIECIAEGYPIPEYRWYRVDEFGQLLPLQPKTILLNYNREVIIPNLQRDDIGTYRCEVTNIRTVISEKVTLQLQIDPIFVVPLDDQVLDIGTTLSWYCEAYPNDQITYSWFSNGTEIVWSRITAIQQQRVKINNNLLQILNIQPIDSGVYQCAATNIQNSVTRFSTAELRVIQLPPTFGRTPLLPTLRSTVGGLVTIICNPEGAPRPQIQWMKNNVQFTSGGNVMIYPNGNLAISNVQLTDAGNYSCVASNPFGVSQMSTYLYVMPEGTTIITPPGGRDVIVNQTIVIPCDARSMNEMDLTFYWRFNGEVLNIDNKRYRQDDLNRPGDLRIVRAQYSNAGVYTCVAITTVDETTSKYQLNVFGPPGPMAGVRCSQAQQRQALLSFVVGTDHGSTIIFYTVEALTNHRPYWYSLANYTITLPANRFVQVPVMNLSAFTDYRFRVAGTNMYGFGEYSEVSPPCVTQPDIPGAYPARLGGGGGKVGDLRVVWEPLPMDFWNGPGLQYRIYARKDKENQELVYNVTDPLRNFYITHLADKINYQTYIIRISAVNTLGEGPVSPSVIIKSAENRPTRQVMNVKCSAYNSTAMTVTWDMIDETDIGVLNGKLLGYNVRYWQEGLVELENYWDRRFPGQRSRAIIIGLEPNTEYKVRIFVYTQFGDSPESSEFSHRTFRLPPMTPPQYISIRQPRREKDRRVRILNELFMYRLEVEWRGISNTADEEPIEGYMIKVWEHYQSIRNATIYYTPATKYKWTIENLYKNRNYKLRVQAYSLGGEGKYSSPEKEFRFDNDGRLLILYNPDTSLLYHNSISSTIPKKLSIFLILVLFKLTINLLI
ncbi:unnamed protein product, partial [Didymodactylos carnosus]